MSAGMFNGQVDGPGFGHFSKCRPNFYQTVLELSGLSLHQGTINIKIDGEMPHFPMRKTQRIPGQDPIDLDHKQDILITPCLMEGRPGFWILPVFKGTNLPNPKGHLPRGVIEVSLIEKLPQIAPGLRVSLEILGDLKHLFVGSDIRKSQPHGIRYLRSAVRKHFGASGTGGPCNFQ